jgi:hypothetical protein
MLYRLTGTAGTSAYVGYHSDAPSWGAAKTPSGVPTASLQTAHDICIRRFDAAENAIIRWTDVSTGGQFAALEIPEILINEIRVFFACGAHELCELLFPHLRGLYVEQVQPAAAGVVMQAHSRAAGAACPACGAWSSRWKRWASFRLSPGSPFMMPGRRMTPTPTKRRARLSRESGRDSKQPETG